MFGSARRSGVEVSEKPPEVPPSWGPLNPRPGVLLLAVLLTFGLFFNAWLDSQPGDYDGKYVTVMTAALIAGVLGFDLRRFWRGGGGGDQ